MSVLEFVARLAGSLAWPLVALIIVVILRQPLAALLAEAPRRVKRVKVGPVEAEWARELSVVQVELEEAGLPVPDRRAVRGPVTEDLASTVEASPETAVMEGYGRVTQALRQKLEAAGHSVDKRLGAAGLAREAARRGLIGEKAARTVEGLAILRNLAAHGYGGRDSGGVTEQQAADYLALVDAALYVLDSPAPPAERSATT